MYLSLCKKKLFSLQKKSSLCWDIELQSYKWEKHHNLTQNLNALGYWVISLRKCSTFTFSSDVRYITHTWYTVLSNLLGGGNFFSHCFMLYLMWHESLDFEKIKIISGFLEKITIFFLKIIIFIIFLEN